MACVPVEQLVCPDIASAETLFNTPGWPASYDFIWGDANLPTAWVEPGAVLSAPTLWRYLTPADLDGYEERYAFYFDRAVDVAEDAFSGAGLQGRIASGRFSNSGAGAPMSADFDVLESVRYLTRNGMPEKFMVVEGIPGAHYGWAFTATSRGADLLIAILENVGERAIDVGTFRINSTDAMTVRTYRETTRLLDEAGPTERLLWPPGVLRPGEKLVIPVRIECPSPPSFSTGICPDIATTKRRASLFVARPKRRTPKRLPSCIPTRRTTSSSPRPPISCPRD